MKVSESSQKTTIPGVLNVRRYVDKNNMLAGDMIYDVNTGIGEDKSIVDPFDNLRRKNLSEYDNYDLLKPLFRDGKFVSEEVDVMQAQKLAANNLAALDETQKRTLNPHTYPVGLEGNLNEKRIKMVTEVRGLS